MKIIIWGTGGTWRFIKEYIDFDEVDIVGFVDSNPSQKIIRVNGRDRKVFLPCQFFAGENVVFDKILVASVYFAEICYQLINEYGVAREKVEIYDNPSRLIMKDSYFREKYRAETEKHLYKKVYAGMHLQAKILNILNADRDVIRTIREVEYKVYSQWGEDGIIQYLIHRIPIPNKTFIEFGVEDYQEANTRFLLENDNWSGMIMDGNNKNIESVKKEALYWKYDLQAVTAFVTKENINELLCQSGFDSDLGILSIDIDGNDYWVMRQVDVMKPRILICEYNAIYGGNDAVTIPYKPDFNRTKEHYSNLYYGASLKAMKEMAREKGYCFIGVNSNACNAFFVREDVACYLPKAILEDNVFLPHKYRQARDKDGRLTFLSGEEEIKLIAELDVYDIYENRIKKVRELNL